MKKKKLGKNRGIWCGVVVSTLEFNHELKDKETNEVIERFYKFDIETEIKDKKGEVVDASILPVIVSETKINSLEEKPTVGKVVFMKGSWRTRDHNNESQRNKLEQYIFVKTLEVHKEFPVKTRNKYEFEGVLVKKLFIFERDAEGNPIKDADGKLIPKRDDKGNIIYTTRKNKEGKRVNDYTVAINRPNGSDYIPCISYMKLAKFVAENVDINAEVKGDGFVRAREYENNGKKGVAYEIVVQHLEIKEKTEK